MSRTDTSLRFRDGSKAMGVIAVRLGRLRVCRDMEPTTVDQSADLEILRPRERRRITEALEGGGPANAQDASRWPESPSPRVE